ncbi:MAG: ABC transporter ATP-binding protein [Lachnospiraceae bacterium]|nr:ABC transporter ATP-binding protein [Lachnospiraceae bacterium]
MKNNTANTKKSIYRSLNNKFFYKNKVSFTFMNIAALITAFLNIAVSWLMQQLVDVASGKNELFTFKQLFFISLIFFAAFFVVIIIKYYAWPGFMKKAMRQYKEFAFKEITGKDISSFRKENTSLYLSALTNDAVTVETEYLEKIPDLITHTVSFVLAAALMLYYSPLLTLIAIGLTLLPLLASVLTGQKAAPIQKKVSESNNSFTSALSDFLDGFFVVKSFKAEKEVIDLFAKTDDELENNKSKMRKITHVIGSIGGMCGILAQLGVFFAGAAIALSGKALTPGMVIVFVQLMNYMIAPVSNIPMLLAKKKAANALMEKLATELEKNRDDVATTELNGVNEGIRLEDVSFSYDGDKEILHNISLDFKAGKSYAIVGGSGSGKSTLLNLLLTTGSNNHSGHILVDDKELDTLSAKSLYENISVIGQNVFLFNSTIEDNITMFKEFPAEKVNEAIAKAHLSKLIAEHGNNYNCGENGKNLSGGEKQRISIARSLLRKSSVLLADEITAALDAKTAFEVSNEILDLEGITRIVVTHALDEALLKRYDEIIVLRDGRVEEVGTFDNLINNQGYFHALYTVSNNAA